MLSGTDTVKKETSFSKKIEMINPKIAAKVFGFTPEEILKAKKFILDYLKKKQQNYLSGDKFLLTCLLFSSLTFSF